MNKYITFGVLLITLTSIFAQDNSFTKYEEYIQKYGKKFASLDELAKHYQAYQSNMDHVVRLNSENPTEEGEDVTYGETEFSDMDPEEFQKRYLTFTIPEAVSPAQNDDKTSGNSDNSQGTEGDNAVPAAPSTDAEPSTNDNADSGRNLQQEDDSLRNLQSIPSSWDWRTKGAVGVVKNQGSCGACWAFATAANIEGLYYRKYGVIKNFSEQQMLDCSTANYGCNGGFMEKAMAYVKTAGGLQQTSDYGSYKQYRKTCSFNRNKAVAKVKSWVFPGSNEVTIRNYVYNNGPITAALNANTLQYYRGGIVNVSCSRTVNHAVTLVGYGSANGLDYGIVKNSGGAPWGETGAFRINRGVGRCGINTYVVPAVRA
jgi:C1A family cysteine protease